jgi:hypothetical protein
MSKTPYEIRLEIVRQAQDHVTAKFWNDWDKFNIEKEHRDKAGYTSAGYPVSALAGMSVPVFPTTEDILAEAAKYKKFVDKE